MNTRNILSALAFLLAIGSAIASEMSASQKGYSRKIEVPAQSQDCEYRRDCPGGQNVCTASFNIGPQEFSNVPLFDSPVGECGAVLTMQ